MFANMHHAFNLVIGGVLQARVPPPTSPRHAHIRPHPTMSRAAKTTLIATIIGCAATIAGVHYLQQEERAVTRLARLLHRRH